MPLREDGYYYHLSIYPEETQIEGNASAIDDKTDEETVSWIQRQLALGNWWAWCVVKIVCYHEQLPASIYGTDFLGMCSYRSEQDFKDTSGYYEDMKARARAELDDLVLQILQQAGSE